MRLPLSFVAALYYIALSYLSARTTGFSRTTVRSVTPTGVRMYSMLVRQVTYLAFSNNANIDGPELFQIEIKKPGDVDSNYQLLCEYIYGWAQLFEEENGKKMGLSTPVTVAKLPGAVKLEFRATKTGAAYKSSKEEKIQESERGKYIKPSNDESNSQSSGGKGPDVKIAKEGGVEIRVELEPVLRVRAKRCNMGDETIVKEMSEKIILKKLKDAVEFWVKH